MAVKNRFFKMVKRLAWFLGFPLILLLGKLLWDNEKYYLMSLCVVVLAMVPFAKKWEKGILKKRRELVVIAVMSAMAVGARSLFYMLPQVKPMAAIVIITGVALGANAGFVTGAVSALVSNFLFGQGPWTPWQMIAFGLLGFFAGCFFSSKKIKTKKDTLWLSIYGGISVFLLYGIIMDTATVVMMTQNISWSLLRATYLTGVVFNFIHGLGTAVFLWILSMPILKKLYRINKKYGIISS